MAVLRVLRRYAWAPLSVAIATVAIALGPPVFRGEALAFIFLAAVLVSAYRAGLGPGIAAILLSLLAAFGLFRTPRWDFANPDYILAEIAFIVIGLLLTSLITHRRRANRALRDSEAQYRYLVQNANSAILRWRRDGTVTFFNEYAQSFFGYTAEEIVGKHAGILLPARESTGQDLSGLVQDIVARPERYTQNVNENVCKDGRRVWMLWTNRPIFDQNGEVQEVLGIGSDITARIHAEEARQKSEERFRAFLSASSDAVFRMNADWSELRQLMGGEFIPNTDTPSRDWLNTYIHPDDQPVMLEAFQAAVQNKSTFSLEHRVRRIDETWGWMQSRAIPLLNEHGEIVEWIGAALDITDRKDTEQAFRTSRLLLETIVTHMPAAACIIHGDDLRLQSVNPAYQAFAPDKPMVGRTLEEIWPETGRSFSEMCRVVLETGEPLHFIDEPYTIRRSLDGPLETAYFSWALHRVPLPGKEGWGLLNTAWETTERVLTEEALRRSEVRLRRLYDANLIGVLNFRLDGSIVNANSHFLNMVGYTVEDLQAQRIDWSRMTPPEYRHLDERAITLLKTSGEDMPYEKEYIRKDGSRVPIFIGAAMTDEINEEGIAFVLDMTERKRFEKELREINETLEERVRQRTTELERSQEALKQSERLATIGEVMTGLSHESRNALQRGLVGIEILERRLKDQPALQQLVLEVRKAHQDLRRVYDNVQDYARPITLDRKTSDVALAWRRAWDSLAAREGRQATLLEDLDEADRECEVDISQLEQVFRNLYDNALAACPDPVEVRVRCQSVYTDAGPQLRVSVRDNGPGVPAEQSKRIFEPFYTTKTKGTGLGLAIVQRIVQAHGGRIALGAEAEDNGLEIVIDMPRRVVLDGPAAADSAGRRRGIPADVHGGSPG